MWLKIVYIQPIVGIQLAAETFFIRSPAAPFIVEPPKLISLLAPLRQGELSFRLLSNGNAGA